MMENIWVGEVDGSPLIYDPAMQLADCPHLFLWSPKSGMSKYYANLVREHIRPLGDRALADAHREKYERWRSSHGDAWLKHTRIEYEERRRNEEALAKKRLDDEELKKNRDAARAVESARIRELVEKQISQERIEEEEFRNLLEEVSAQGFTRSNQVSDYIVKNRLGNKYKNISGILQMEAGGETWSFNGGFPPRIYARLCEEMGLGSNGSQARPVSFKPFKDITGD
jgi:hypothetical protein